MKIGNYIISEEWRNIDQHGSCELMISFSDGYFPEVKVGEIVILNCIPYLVNFNFDHTKPWRLMVPNTGPFNCYRKLFDDEFYFSSREEAICRTNFYLNKMHKLIIFT